MKQAEFQHAYVLHRRVYRESSLLVELFTQVAGRISVIAKGARRPSSKAHGLLQPFIPLLVSWSGKSELKTLTSIEVAADQFTRMSAFVLHGDCLFAGFYLNELLMYLLQKWDAHPKLYSVYADTLADLQNDGLQQKTLRIFEKRLLSEIGYGLLQTFLPDEYYRFVPEHGFVIEKNEHAVGHRNDRYIFSGKNLLAIAREDWDEENLQIAKYLLRAMLSPLLGVRPLNSRQLFNVYR